MSFYTEWQLTLLADHNELFIFHLLVRYTCRGLFERHKLLFSFQMCSKILEAAGKLNMDEYNFFLRGGVVSSFESPFPLWFAFLFNSCSRTVDCGLWSSILGVWDLFNGKKYFLYFPQVDISLDYFRLWCIKIRWKINFQASTSLIKAILIFRDKILTCGSQKLWEHQQLRIFKNSPGWIQHGWSQPASTEYNSFRGLIGAL